MKQNNVTPELVEEIAELAADALVGAGILAGGNFERAKEIIEEEAIVRLTILGALTVPVA